MPTKTLTPADTVEAAERQLADAIVSEQETTAALDALKERIRADGPAAVSAEELLAATARADHAKLSTGHAQRITAEAHTAARLVRLHDLKSEIRETGGSANDAAAAIEKIAEGVAALVSLCDARNGNFTRWTNAMRREGIPNSPDTSEGNASLGWVRSDWTGDALKVDDRTIRQTRPGVLVEAALVKGVEAAGHRASGSLDPIRPTRDGDLVDDTAQWLAKSW
jgi:hypothetical protein